MPISSSGSVYGGGFQRGLWGMQVAEVCVVHYGESNYYEVEQKPIKSVLPLMTTVNEGMGNQSLGRRCAAMAGLRYAMVHSLHRPNSNYERLSPAEIMGDANAPQASEYSQATLMRLLAMQLIGAGYDVNHQCQVRRVDPGERPLIGKPEGFQGYGIAKTLVNGLSTSKSQIQKVTGFMESIRGLAREYLAAHESVTGTPGHLAGSDQLAHRGRLIVLAADPQRLQSQPDMVLDVLGKLDTYERGGIIQSQDANDASTLCSALARAKAAWLPANT